MPAGRPLKPTALKVLQGTLEKSRANPDEPQLPVEYPEPPEDFSPDELAAWNLIRRLLEPMRVVTAADFIGLMIMAETLADRRRIRSGLPEEGAYSYESSSEKGGTTFRMYPEISALSVNGNDLFKQLARYGLTPSDRSRVKATLFQDPDDDPDAEFTRGR